MKLTYDILEEKCEVKVTNDDMEVWLTLKDPDHVIEYEEEPILQYLTEKGIVQGILGNALKKALEKKVYDEPFMIAEGIPATDGKDGYFEYFFDTDIQVKPKENEDGSVDYLNMKLFEEATEGQRLVRYHPATKGVCGFTVMKKIIKAKDGKNLPVLKGKGFEYDKERMEYTAKLDGRIVFREGSLTIDPLYVVDEVNYATGNIKFRGDVLVKQNVRNGLKVEADGDIMINGNVESAMVAAGGNVLVKHGATTDTKCEIRAGGTISGKFFEGVTLEAGDSVFSDYYLNCETDAENSVVATGRRGMIAGGITRCKEEVKVTNLGNGAGLATKIKMFYEEYTKERKNQCLHEMEALQDEKEMIESEISRFKESFHGEDISKSLQYMKLAYQLKIRDDGLAKLEKKFKTLQEAEKQKSGCVIVEGIIFPGTQISFGSIDEMVTMAQREVQYTRVGNKIEKEALSDVRIRQRTEAKNKKNKNGKQST